MALDDLPCELACDGGFFLADENGVAGGVFEQLGSGGFQVVFEPVNGFSTDGDDALFTAFADDVEQATFKVESRQGQLGGFGNAQSACVQGFE